MGNKNQNAAGAAKNPNNPVPNNGTAGEVNTGVGSTTPENNVEKKELTIDVDSVKDGETMEIENTVVTFKKEAKTNVKTEKTHGTNVAQVKRGITVIREYSRETHGENFADLAHEFASNHGGDVEVK